MMRVKEERGKSWLKRNIKKKKTPKKQKTNSWKLEREKIDAVTDFLFWGSKITAENDCSHEIRRHLLLKRKAMTNLGYIL